MDKKKNVFWIGMTSLLNDASSEMIMSLLPLFLLSLGASRAMIGFIEGVAEFTASIFKVISGWVSDRLQARKSIVVFGYGLSTIIKPLIALANTWYQVLAVRFVDRLGKGVRNAPRDALVADSVSSEERGAAFGLQRGMDTFGAVIGTVLASLFLFFLGKYTNLSITEQYRTIFWFSIIPGILAILTVAFMVVDIKSKETVTQIKSAPWNDIGPGFIAFLVVSAVFEFSNFSYAIFIIRADNLGVAVALIPMLYLLYNIIYGLLSQPLGQAADKIGKKTILFLGYLLAAIMCFGFAVANNFIYAWLLFAIYGVVSAITNTTPRAILADLVSSKHRATAYGIYYMLIGLIALPTSMIAGYLWDRFGAFIAFSYGAVLAGIASALVLFLIPKFKGNSNKI